MENEELKKIIADTTSLRDRIELLYDGRETVLPGASDSELDAQLISEHIYDIYHYLDQALANLKSLKNNTRWEQ